MERARAAQCEGGWRSGPLDLVRQHPEIAVEFVQGAAGIKLPGEIAVSLAPTDMSAVVPVQYLADMVVLISDAATSESPFWR
jgi:hypothetical protein